MPSQTVPCDICGRTFGNLKAAKKHYISRHAVNYKFSAGNGQKVTIQKNENGYFFCPIHKRRGRSLSFVEVHRPCFLNHSSTIVNGVESTEDRTEGLVKQPPMLGIEAAVDSESTDVVNDGESRVDVESISSRAAEQSTTLHINYMPALKQKSANILELLQMHIDTDSALKLMRALRRLRALSHHKWDSICRNTDLVRLPETQVDALFYDLCRHEYFWDATTLRHRGFFMTPKLSRELEVPVEMQMPESIPTCDLVAALGAFGNGSNMYGLLAYIHNSKKVTVDNPQNHEQMPANVNTVQDLISFDCLEVTRPPEK